MDIDVFSPLAGAAFKDAAGLAGTSSNALDPASYRPYLADLDVTDEQANELLAILWDIMTRFVDLGWNVDLVCEQVFGSVDLPATADSEEL